MRRRTIPLLAILLLGGCTTPRGSMLSAQLPAEARQEPERYVLVTFDNAATTLPSRGASTLRGYDSATGYVVSGRAHSTARAIAEEYELDAEAAWPIPMLRVHCLLYRVAADSSRDAMLARLAADPRVRLAQPLQTFETAATAYNDRYVGLQRGFEEVSIALAHQWSQGSGVTVAIIDTGVDTTHPDLSGRIRSSRNFVAPPSDPGHRERHGTEVAGVIAAVGNNGQGIVGIAPRVDLLAYRACWQLRAHDAAAECNSYTLAQALSAAIEARADIVNLSLVGPADPLLAALARKATASGTIVVGAVPASGRLDGFPAGAPGVLAVVMAERTQADTDALPAPGREILTLVPDGRYDFATGSSVSTAIVSGVVALLRSRRPTTDAASAHDLLARSTRSVAAPAGNMRSIDACRALTDLLGTGDCPDGPTPEPAAQVRVERDGR